MKFGKQIQAEQVPGWSAYYLDYKFLKKIISSLASQRPASEAAALALGVRPGDLLNPGPQQPQTPRSPAPAVPTQAEPTRSPLFTNLVQDASRGSDFQAYKAAFFFKLERELEKINSFYLQKEAELKLRLETLLTQRRAAAMRVLPDKDEENIHNHVEWTAVEEGFRQLGRDLAKLQHFVEINATGFRKILKKWDKRSKSSTKELYLSRQVDVQPVFDRQLISEMSDIVAACLLDITDLSIGLKVENPGVEDLILSHQTIVERSHTGPFHALESNLRKAVEARDEAAIRDVIKYSDTLASHAWGRTSVARILWKAIIDAPVQIADLILASPAQPFDFSFVDDVSGRTCLHEAAMANAPRLIALCLEHGVPPGQLDLYGRSALHYACLYPAKPQSEPDQTSAEICRQLLSVGISPAIADRDNYTPLIHAVVRGSVDCVGVLLEAGVTVGPQAPGGSLLPLALAAQAGHVGVVQLLLTAGASSVPNTNGEYPIHLAAREGHTEIVRVLLTHEGWDTPDKYNDWTPLFHAARGGHPECVSALLGAGARIDIVDEFGYTPEYYAAWYGHRACVVVLAAAVARLPSRRATSQPPHLSPLSQEIEKDELDLIPSLSLPPPIMPYRVYGHNYLDKACLVQVTLGRTAASAEEASPVQLHSKISGSQPGDRRSHATSFLKLVISGPSQALLAPYSVALPLKDERPTFSFQIASVDQLSLEFSLYPNFGTKTVGRGVALPSMFRDVPNRQSLILPLVDQRLHVIGEICFEVNVITPFSGVTLEIGGAVETYWKSMAMPTSISAPRRSLGLPSSGHTIASATTSPSVLSTAAVGGHALTVSSIAGSYLYLVIQVTRDLHPVVYASWKLPEDEYDLCVADVTLEQFEALAIRKGRNLDSLADFPTSPSEWRDALRGTMVSLSKLIQALQPTIGVCLEFAYASFGVAERYAITSQASLNEFVDAVLRAVYQNLDRKDRRSVVFTSFFPDVCAALNWKQPNYPVFFASCCGNRRESAPGPTAVGSDEVPDRRLFTLVAAVEFAKSNNLLGVLLDAELLAQVPLLVQGVRDTGLLIGTFGSTQEIASLAQGEPDVPIVDAVLADGVLTYLENVMRGLV